MDIKRNGLLDYKDDTLEFLEYVSASIHSGMDQPRDVMTGRIVRAVANPWVTTLNHPHGRLIGSRPPYEVDMAAVIAACAEHGVAMEINSQPERMDLDGVTARLAREAGVKLVINTDAHATRQLDMLRYGVATARRAWCGPEDVLNCLSRDQFAEHLAARRRRAEGLRG
jgi:DNA polymerase (family 10)